MIKCYTFFCCFILCCVRLIAQPPTQQDCLGAIPICQQIYSEVNSPSGIGNYDEINPDLSCSSKEDNTIWYTFTVSRSGNFGFLISPNDRTDDYDWWLFDVTGGRCADIGTDPRLTISCNVSGGDSCDGLTGATGASVYSQQGSNCDAQYPNADPFGGGTAFNALIPVLAGNTYALCISNWKGSPYGYEIDFGYSGDIGILDEVPPQISTIDSPTSCESTTIGISFTENIQCSTISSTNFSLDGPGGPYTLALRNEVCDAGGAYSSTFLLDIAPSISAFGDFRLSMQTDNQTEILDLCGNPAASSAQDFVIPIDPNPLDLDYDGDSVTICEGERITLDATHPNATYLWSDGSNTPTITVGTPGAYEVTVTSECRRGTATISVVQIADLPSVDLGEDKIMCDDESITLDATTAGDRVEYLWSDGSRMPQLIVAETGSYHVMVSDRCSIQRDTIEILEDGDFDVELGQARTACVDNAVTLYVPDAGTIRWSTGETNNVINVTASDDYSVTVTTACHLRTDTVAVRFVEPLADIALGRDTTLCLGASLLLDTELDSSATYEWQDGSTKSSLVADQPGQYRVIASNVCGAVADKIDIAYYQPIVVTLGRDTILCAEEWHILDASSDVADYYLWEDGSNEELRYIRGPGSYSVRVSNVCEEVVATIDIPECTQCTQYVPNAFSPNDDGYNDIFQPFSSCPMQYYELRIFDRWGNQVYTGNDPQSGWDGSWKNHKMTTGVYTWYVEYTVDEDGALRSVTNAGEVLLNR